MENFPHIALYNGKFSTYFHMKPENMENILLIFRYRSGVQGSPFRVTFLSLTEPSL